MRKFKSYGTGDGLVNVDLEKNNIIVEDGCRFFHPENIELNSNIYFGHDCYIHAYHNGKLVIGNNVWIGPSCYIHAAGQIYIGENVGIGAYCKLITSSHELSLEYSSILNAPLNFKKISIEDGVDIGVGSVILPGVTLHRGAQIGANSVVTKDVEENSIVAGNPAKKIRYR
ncbi:acyltransferase [bacterium]|nr:acyltransferase [bacterium]